MKKMFWGLGLSALVIGATFIPNMTEAAVQGGKGTAVLTVKTKANWYIAGQESITLQSNQIANAYGNGRNGSVARGIFDVYLDGKYVGKLGASTTPLGGSLTVKLGRNKQHTIKVVYNASATATNHKNVTGRTMQSNATVHWYVSGSHKVENYW